MAAKDLFSKRQPSNTKGSRPEAPVRTPAPRVLLVCEGEKTEQGFAQYGKGMKGVFALLEPKLPIAMQHATTLAAQASAQGPGCGSTMIMGERKDLAFGKLCSTQAAPPTWTGKTLWKR